MTRADAVRQLTGTDEYGYVARTDLGTAIRVALGIVDVVGVGDPTILLLLVVVVGDVAEELVAVATIGGEDAVASILATLLRVEATGIGVVELAPTFSSLPRFAPKSAVMTSSLSLLLKFL